MISKGKVNIKKEKPIKDPLVFILMEPIQLLQIIPQKKLNKLTKNNKSLTLKINH